MDIKVAGIRKAAEASRVSKMREGISALVWMISFVLLLAAIFDLFETSFLPPVVCVLIALASVVCIVTALAFGRFFKVRGSRGFERAAALTLEALEEMDRGQMEAIVSEVTKRFEKKLLADPELEANERDKELKAYQDRLKDILSGRQALSKKEALDELESMLTGLWCENRLDLIEGNQALITFWSYLKQDNVDEKQDFMVGLASEEGYEYRTGGDDSLIVELEELGIKKSGFGMFTKNLLEKSDGQTTVRVFDYVVREQTTEGHFEYFYRMIAYLNRPGMRLPAFRLGPEGLLGKIGGSLGFQDIDFHSNPEFSKLYILKGDDERAVRRLFSPEVLHFYQRQKRVHSAGKGDKLVFFTGQAGGEWFLTEPEKMAEFIENANAAFKLLSRG